MTLTFELNPFHVKQEFFVRRNPKLIFPGGTAWMSANANVGTPTFRAIVDMPTFRAIVDMPTFRAIVDTPTFRAIVDTPTFRSIVDAPTFHGAFERHSRPRAKQCTEIIRTLVQRLEREVLFSVND
jgi:hypothetical protein